MISNIEIAQNTLESIETLQQATTEIYYLAAEGNYEQFTKISEIMLTLFESIQGVIDDFSKENASFTIIKKDFLDNGLHSLKNIIRLAKVRSFNVFLKIEFELIPILSQLYLEYYYLAFIDGDAKKEEEFSKDKCKQLQTSNYLEEGVSTGEYKYDVSITVIAYNKLKYTKLCIESILEHTSQNINYELILINHGSTDGTKEYFESVGCTKQFDFLNNGSGSRAHLKAVQGEYVCAISNDIIVGPNYLDNMLACIKSDPAIKYVVPTTTNISNLQTIPFNFKSLEDMRVFAQQNNKQNPYRWEQRIRLCDPIKLYRSADFLSTKGLGYIDPFFKKIGFGDDRISLLVRRSGGKCMLAKDSFCYHFGSVTLKDDKVYNDSFAKGRKTFEKIYGIDPWGLGFCYDYNLFEALPCNDTEEVNVLGINCGLGANPLKVKEKLKEVAHNLNVTVYNITDEKRYLQDLESVSNQVKYIPEQQMQQMMGQVFPGVKFKYIIFEDIGKYNMKKVLPILNSRLCDNGKLCVLNYKVNDMLPVSSELYKGLTWYISK